MTVHEQTKGPVYTLSTLLWLPSPLEEVFAFFAEARNLEAITPPWLQFVVLTSEPIIMQRGTRIDYRLRLHGLPLRWQSEITVWEPPQRFVDEQRRGPYRVWIHEHTFETRDGGTLVRDHVTYAARGGAWLHRWCVRPDLERIFAYRQRTLEAIFRPGAAAHGPSAR